MAILIVIDFVANLVLFFYSKTRRIWMVTKIVELIVVIAVAICYVGIFAICRASGDAERRYEELAAKKFSPTGGEVNAV